MADNASAERSQDFNVDDHGLSVNNYTGSKRISSKDTLFVTTSPSKSPTSSSNATPTTRQAEASSAKDLVKDLPEAIQCDPALTNIIFNSKDNGLGNCNKETAKTNGVSQIRPTQQPSNGTKSNGAKDPKNSKTKAANSKDKASKQEETNDGNNTHAPKFSALVQCDPCLVGFLFPANGSFASSNNNINKDKVISEKVNLLSLPQRIKGRSKMVTRTAAIPCSPNVDAPSTYLEVEPLMSQMVPKRVADAINLELSKSSLVEREDTNDNKQHPDNVDDETPKVVNGNKADTKDWQTLPQNLAGKVAFFEKLMKQKQENPTADVSVKVKAEVSEKVKSAHNQVQTSLLATKVNKETSGVTLPSDLTPLAQKKERVETFFPKEDVSVPFQVTNTTDNKSTTTWNKVETAPPKSFEVSDETTPMKEEKKESTTTISFPPLPGVEDLVSAMEKNLDNQLHDLDNDLQNLDNKLDDLNTGPSSDAEDEDVQLANEMETFALEEAAVEAAAEERNAEEEKAETKSEANPSSLPIETQADLNPIKETSESVHNQKSPVQRAITPGNQEPDEAVSEAKSEDTGNGLAEEEEVSSPSSPKQSITTTAVNGGKQPSAEKLKSNALKSLDGLDSRVSSEEVHGETLSRDIATEVLEDSEDVEEEEEEGSAVDSAFPPLVTEAPQSPRRSQAQISLSKSYARALAEGKKLEQPTALDIYQMILSQSPPRPDSKQSNPLPEGVVTSTDRQTSLEIENVKEGPLSSATENIDKTQGSTAAKGGSDAEVSATLNSNPKDCAFVKNIRANESSSSLDVMDSVVNDSERTRMEGIAQRLAEATPQKILEMYEIEAKGDFSSVTPGFTEINRESRRGRMNDGLPKDARRSNRALKPTVVEDITYVQPTSTLSKANFNPYSPLIDAPDNFSFTTGQEKEKGTPNQVKGSQKQPKAKDQKSTGKVNANRKKKAVRFGSTRTSTETPGKAKRETSEFADNDNRSWINILLLPVHIINNLVHVKPLSYIIDGAFWAILLLVGGPFAAIGTVFLTIYRLACYLARLLGFGVIKPNRNPEQKLAVVITGCDTGFGRDLAFSLMREGFVVFCCCLQKESLKDFQGEELAMPLQMDVTKGEDVEKASKAVMEWLSGEDGRYLHALVNNAGIGRTGLTDWLTINDFQRVMDVNYYGMVRCCKKFLALFKFQASNGIYSDARIVNMVSMAGLTKGGITSVAYESSKHAADVFTTNLRLETSRLGLKTTTLSPGHHKTAITQGKSNTIRKTFNSLPPEKQNEYGEEFLEPICKKQDWIEENKLWDSRHVVDAMVKAVTFKNPPARIMIGSDARYLFIFHKMLPAWFSSRRPLSHVPAMIAKKK